MERKLYPVQEFCQRYAISRTAFYREVKAKRLNILKRGRRTMVADTEAKRWCDSLPQALVSGGNHAAR